MSVPTADSIYGTTGTADTPVRCSTRNGVATITLNRPDRLNTMNDEMLQQMLVTLESLAGDEGVRVVIVTGSGRGFCAGGDLSAGTGGGIGGDIGAEERIGLMRRYMTSSQLLHDMGKVTIAAVNGPCAGAGLAWACACDLRFASESAVFRTAFLSAGVSGDFGGTWTLSRIVGNAAARELYLLNGKVLAQDANRMGLVSAVYPGTELLSRVQAIASEIAAGAPLAITAIKQNLNDAESRSFSESLDNEIRRHVQCMETEDGKEATAAFLEKRRPQFHGR
jgi:2-(1,2-epoxy-1,2-dihydrophenyl)acetyl-CoA isomerase